MSYLISHMEHETGSYQYIYMIWWLVSFPICFLSHPHFVYNWGMFWRGMYGSIWRDDCIFNQV